MMVDTSPLSAQDPRELGQQNKWSKWILQGAVIGLVGTAVLVMVGGAVAVRGGQIPTAAVDFLSASSDPAPPTVGTCPPKDWLLQALGGGHWIINTTDETSWAWYMEFLDVKKKDWPAEFHATDMHQYIWWTNSSGLFYIMNHTIPATGFHLLFEADAMGIWRPNPYPVLTPAGYDPASSKVDLLKVRYLIEEPGSPFPDSCWAFRCDMPVAKNVTIEGKIVLKEYVVSFWRELVSPTSMRCTLYITDADTGETIAPWDKPYGQKPADRIAGKPKGLSYRWFERSTQSLEDALERLPCSDSGIPGDDHQFC
jgi:hypothetical protein